MKPILYSRECKVSNRKQQKPPNFIQLYNWTFWTSNKNYKVQLEQPLDVYAMYSIYGSDLLN